MKTVMTMNDNSWSYNEFLAFLMVYGAEMNNAITPAELEFIRQKTGIQDIEKIKSKVDSINDMEALDVIDHYKKKYLSSPESAAKARFDLEALLKTEGSHSQLEKVVVHLIEKLL